MPAGELRGKAHVLPALADRERILVRRHGHVYRVVLVGINLHGFKLRRRERLGDVALHVFRPADDIDLLAVQLAYDIAHARTAQAHARAHGIDLLVHRAHRDLAAVARITRHRNELDHAIRDLGDLQTEERAHELARRAGERHGGARGVLLHVMDDGANRIAHGILLGGDALLRGKNHLRLADHHIKVAAVQPRHGTGDDLADAPLEIVERVRADGLAQLLHDHLARGLRGDASETRSRQLNLNSVALLLRGIETLGARHGNETCARILVGDDHRVIDMESDGFAVDDHAKVVRDTRIAACRLLDGLFNRHQDDFTVHAVLAFDVVHHRQQLVVRHFSLSFLSKIKTIPFGDPMTSVKKRANDTKKRPLCQWESVFICNLWRKMIYFARFFTFKGVFRERKAIRLRRCRREHR